MADITIHELYARLQSITNNLPRILDEIVMDNAPLAIKLNQNQLIDGEMPDDKAISPEYRSVPYARFKNQRNSRPTLGVPDLNLTGANYAGIKLRGSNLKYELYNTNNKAPSLIKKYGDYMGHNKDSRTTFTNANDLKFLMYVKNATGL